MRIIKNGVVLTKEQIKSLKKYDIEHQKTCSNCGCVFAYNDNDKKKHFDYTNIVCWDTVKCPSCDYEMIPRF